MSRVLGAEERGGGCDEGSARLWGEGGLVWAWELAESELARVVALEGGSAFSIAVSGVAPSGLRFRGLGWRWRWR